MNGVILNNEERGISAGGIELLDAIRPLWEELNLHHAEKSRYFSDDYRAFTFDDRKEDLLRKARKGKFRISVYKQEGMIRGYSIASIKGAEGEVDSIYVRKAARGARIGEALMKDCLRWLKENGSKRSGWLSPTATRRPSAFTRNTSSFREPRPSPRSIGIRAGSNGATFDRFYRPGRKRSSTRRRVAVDTPNVTPPSNGESPSRLPQRA